MKISKSLKTIGFIAVVSLAASLAYSGGDHAHGDHKHADDKGHKHGDHKHKGGHSHGPGGHSHDAPTIISEKEAKAVAIDVVKKLVKEKKLKADWLKIEVKTTGKKIFKEKEEWVITLENVKAEKSKQILYVFLSLKGEYLGANFTGN